MNRWPRIALALALILALALTLEEVLCRQGENPCSVVVGGREHQINAAHACTPAALHVEHHVSVALVVTHDRTLEPPRRGGVVA